MVFIFHLIIRLFTNDKDVALINLSATRYVYMLFFCHTDLFHGRINLFFDIILFSVIDSYVSPPPCFNCNLDHVMKINKGSSTLTILIGYWKHCRPI